MSKKPSKELDDSVFVSDELPKPDAKFSDLIKPDIIIPGVQHPLKEIYDSKPKEELPVLKAVGFFNLDPKRLHNFASYTVTFQGDKVLEIKVTEPNMRRIAEESTKIAFVTHFIDAYEER